MTEVLGVEFECEEGETQSDASVEAAGDVVPTGQAVQPVDAASEMPPSESIGVP